VILWHAFGPFEAPAEIKARAADRGGTCEGVDYQIAGIGPHLHGVQGEGFGESRGMAGAGTRVVPMPDHAVIPEGAAVLNVPNEAMAIAEISLRPVSFKIGSFPHQAIHVVF
jgi:hypothetical protein